MNKDKKEIGGEAGAGERNVGDTDN